MDFHFIENQKKKEEKSKIWFLTRSDWISNRIESNHEIVKKSPVIKKEYIIPSVPSLGALVVACPVCKETFEQFFKHGNCSDRRVSGDAEQWHLKNAVRPEKGPNARAYHPGCYADKCA